MPFSGSAEPLAAVIFDLDGTLVDSIDLYYKDLQDILARVGLPPVPKEEVLEVMRAGVSPWDVFIPQGVPNRKEFINYCIAIDKETWPNRYREEARLFPGSRRTIEFLHQRGLALGIVTSGWEENNEITHLLSREGVASYFDILIMKPDTKRTKPAPDPILLCLERMGINPASAIYVGDSPDDIRAGKAAGTATVAVLSGVGTYAMLRSVEPDWIVEGVEDVPGIFCPAQEKSPPCLQ